LLSGKRKALTQTKEGGEEINCSIWQDMKPVTFMSTVHTDEAFHTYREKDRKMRRDVIMYDKERQEAPLRIPNPIDEYNKAMGYVDVHAQLASYYSVQQLHFRNWWPLFYFLLEAVLVNVWVLLRLYGTTRKHRDVHLHIALALIAEGLHELQLDPVQYYGRKQLPAEDTPHTL
jgi:hypothetical protein